MSQQPSQAPSPKSASEGLTIRPAHLSEVTVLADLILAMAWESEALRLDQDTLLAGIQSVFAKPALGVYWVIAQHEALVACTLITAEWSDWHNAPYWWIQSLYIQPECRGHGYFEQLLTTLEVAAKQAGARELRLYVEKDNARAIRVYERNGFEGGHYRTMSKSLVGSASN